jgi:hypothetical protein
MLSRRDFLKISGLTTLAAASGFGAGKIFGSIENISLKVQAFLPDMSSASELVKIISGDAGSIVVKGDEAWKRFLTESFASVSSGSKSGNLIVEVEKLKHSAAGDILFSDMKKNIYNPETDFDLHMRRLRSEVKKQNALYGFSAFYNNDNLLSSLIKSGTSTVIIEDENGIYDQIKLSGSGKEIFIKGPSGKTGISISNNSVHISSSCCRNSLCKSMGTINSNGSMIACAPNKVLIRIERV